MKTPTEKFKSKINKSIIKLTSNGNHTAATHLYQTYFLYKKSLWLLVVFTLTRHTHPITPEPIWNATAPDSHP